MTYLPENGITLFPLSPGPRDQIREFCAHEVAKYVRCTLWIILSRQSYTWCAMHIYNGGPLKAA